ncbi:hypothetical protein [Thalassiella azotivora]
MELRRRLSRWALGRPSVLLVDAPGSRLLRWAAEAALDHRGWRFASSAADADVVLVLGHPGPGLSTAVGLLWTQVPGPRLLLRVPDVDGLGTALDAAVPGLSAWDAGADAEQDQDPWRAAPDRGDDPGGMDHGGMDHGGMDHGGMDHGGMDHGGMDHGGMDHGGMDHGGMDHGGMDVAGLAMAGTAPDRDGLELDELVVALGPWLPAWPTGLVVEGHWQGDVLTRPHATWVDHDPEGTSTSDASADDVPVEAVALDVLQRTATVAGWPSAARSARRARDAVVAGEPGAPALAERVTARVGGSRLLAWSARGAGVAPDGTDAADRVRRWSAVVRDGGQPPSTDLASLGRLLEGCELAAARLVVAGFDLRPGTARDASHRAGSHHRVDGGLHGG